MPPHRFRAPAGNGEILAVPGFADVPRLVEENRERLDRDDVVFGGLPLRQLRALARREALVAAQSSGTAVPGVDSDAPLLLAGHQPELSHPGVWVKNFALNGLAKKLGGIPLHLIVDNDTLKSTSLRFPVFRDRDPTTVHLHALAFDRLDGEVQYEDRPILEPDLFETFARRAASLWPNWGYQPLLTKVWWTGPNVGEVFTLLRRTCERAWGCGNREVSVSRLAPSASFARFSAHILADLPRFRTIYNAAIQRYRDANGIRSANHPASDLVDGEAPFWVRKTGGRRERATAASDVRQLRPRALTLTLFARVCLGDFFIHGIGGGKYDEVTDAIIRDYFGIEPPAYQVLSATLHLPLPGFPLIEADVHKAERQVRDLHWNPQRHLAPEMLARPEVAELVRRKQRLIENQPTEDRREWFRSLHDLTDQLRPFVAERIAIAEATLPQMRAEAEANAILRRRDYSWVLYPEEVLRPFLQQFLDLNPRAAISSALPSRP